MMKTGQRKKRSTKERWVAVSGGFDPLHIGHVRLFAEARKLGDRLVVIVNNDHWLRDKKGFAFMSENERVEIIKHFPYVDRVVLTDHRPGDSDRSVSRALRKVKPHIFANGGDRGKGNVPEDEVCNELGIKMTYNIGRGGKVQSSSWMIGKAAREFGRSVRPWGEFYGWDAGKQWKLKTLYIKPGKRLSLQYHNHRRECWLLVSGDAVATLGEGKRTKKVSLTPGETVYVGKQQVHRLESKKGGIVVEVAYGTFDEDDIVRIDDDHGRPTLKKRS